MPKTLSDMAFMLCRHSFFRCANKLFLAVGLVFAFNVSIYAEEPVTQPSVQDNIREMDTDHDGIVTVYEVRAFIEAKHGAGYEKALMDDMVSSAQGKSCATPFAKSFY